MSDAVTSVEKHGIESVVDQAEVGKLLVNGGSDRYGVEWDAWLTIQECAVYEPFLFSAIKIGGGRMALREEANPNNLLPL